MKSARIAVVGAGVGGLVSAIELAAHGCAVEVFERGAGPGGKAAAAQVAGVSVDAGPTVLTMPWVFDELFARTGRAFRDEVPCDKSEILARHAWPDGATLDLFAERARSVDAVGRVFGAGEARALRVFYEDARQIYASVESPFLRSQKPSLLDVAGRFGALARIEAFRTMGASLARRFRDPRLRQLFGRYATYCGSSPFEAPATLNLVAHVEAEGVYRVRGGMRALVAALESRARALGVAFVYGAEVDDIVVRDGRARGVAWPGGERLTDAVVFNGDVSALATGLLGADARKAAEPVPIAARSLSAVTWTMLARPRGFPLVRHNVFFSRDYAAEFDALLNERALPREPTVYVCAQDRADDDEERGSERLLVLVNAPATGDEPGRWTAEEQGRCERTTWSALRAMGLELEIEASTRTTPVEYTARYPATGGALYGPRARGAMSAFARAGAATRIRGLYLAGGSVHPGPGVPMAALSGSLAASRVLSDLASTGRSRHAGTSGTTSTG